MMMDKIALGNRLVGPTQPVYVIAEIGSNFDGDLDRACHLIDLAVESGADAVKFQSFLTKSIASERGFSTRPKSGFQSKWKKSVIDVYKAAELDRDWHAHLSRRCADLGAHFMSTPYDKCAVDLLDSLGVPAFKVGSGDITWLEMLAYIASLHRPIILATGASSLAEVDEAVRTIRDAGNDKIVLLQCVTNYPSTFAAANVRAMKAMGDAFGCLVGYSDHTPGSVVPIAARALGACVIEKHFTDDKTREGPDHGHAMDVAEFKQMVADLRRVELALGNARKELCDEERIAVELQRRCLRASRDIVQGDVLWRGDVDALRPAPVGSLSPKHVGWLIGKCAKRAIKRGEHFRQEDL